MFCPLKFQIICRPPKIIVLSPQIPFLVALKIILSPQKWTAPQSYQSCSEKSEARWPFVYICHKTVNKALNDEEIVYFGTILMIKTCFGTKLMIKTWFTHFLSLVQFVAIYALLGGPIRPKNCGRGTPTDFKGWVPQCVPQCVTCDTCVPHCVPHMCATWPMWESDISDMPPAAFVQLYNVVCIFAAIHHMN